ncbi:tail length tape measure protein [Vibrio phage 159E36-2a]
MSELRTHTFKIEWGGDEAKNGTIEFTRATRDAAAAEDTLRESFGKNAKVTTTEIKGKKELTREARRLITETNRQNKIYNDTVSTYKNMAKSAHLSADAQEIFNAQVRAGVEPLSAQGKEIATLVKRHQELRSSGSAAQRSMRNTRGVAQNLGWQIQDTAVQLQMGTSAFVVLSQQGSQLASAFGPTGALIGALIAIGGAMAGVAFETLKANEELDKLIKKQAELAEKPEKTAKTIAGLTERIEDLNKQLKQSYIDSERFLTGGLGSAATQLGQDNKKLTDAANERIKIIKAALFEAQKELAEITGQDVAIGSVWNINVGNGIPTDEIEAMNAEMKKEHEDIMSNLFGTDSISKALLNESKVAEQAAQSLINSMQNANRTLTQEYAHRRDVIEKGWTNQEQRTQGLVALNKWYQAEQQKLADKEADRIAKLEAVRIKAENQEISRRQKEANRIASEISRSGSSNALNPVEMEIQQNQERLTRLNQLKTDAGEFALSEQIRLNGLIEAEKKRHDVAMTEAEIELIQNQVSSVGMLAASMSATVDIWATGGADIQAQMDEMNAAQKAMFLVSQSIAAVQAFIDGVSLGSSLAAMFPLAAPAMITFGTAVGAAQSGAIMGATFAGAFDKGGYIPSGQMGIVSEYGDELVNGQLIKGPANVTSREDTAKMMNGGSGNVYVYNQYSDAEVTATKEENGDTSIYVTKKELPQLVGAMASDPNSKMNRNQNKLYKRERRT